MHVIPDPSKITLTIGRALCRPLVRELNLLSQRIKQVEGVQTVMTRLDLHGGQQILVYPLAGVDHAILLRRMALALRAPVEMAAATVRPDPMAGTLDQAPHGAQDSRPKIESTLERESSRITTSQRLRQLIYGGLATAAVGMAWVGLVVPGIPTVPFVILAAALAARSSPALHKRLREGRVFGPMIRDWETYHAVRPIVRFQAAAATLIIVAITFAVAPPSPSMYTLIGTMAVFSLFVVFRLPVIPDDQPDDAHQGLSPAMV